MKTYLKFFILPAFLLPSRIELQCKILPPDEYTHILQHKTGTELKREYEIWRKELTAPIKKFPANIEPDILLTQQSSYKIKMFNTVVQEIARRCSRATNEKDLALFADHFFKSNLQKSANKSTSVTK